MTLYRFRLSVSDIDRPFYGDIDLRVAMHPSESEPYLITRVLAYALNYEPGLVLTPGLCAGDEPAIFLKENDRIVKWIDIGNPTARRLNKAARNADIVRVYTYKDPGLIEVDREVEIFALQPKFLEELARTLKRDNAWTILYQSGDLTVTVEDEAISGALTQHHLAGA